MNLITTITDGIRSLGRLVVQPASAHCDTEDGPAAADGRRALASGNINHALKWVRPTMEDEARLAFDQALKVRTLGVDAAELADRYFLETLVRVHRAGEGAGFDGLKPTGTQLPLQVVTADQSIEEESIEPLRGLIPEDRWPELERRFDNALAKKEFDVDDLEAARDYIDAYVTFFKYAEGEDHAHSCGHHQH
jgi:hypothetical protein